MIVRYPSASAGTARALDDLVHDFSEEPSADDPFGDAGAGVLAGSGDTLPATGSLDGQDEPGSTGELPEEPAEEEADEPEDHLDPTDVLRRLAGLLGGSSIGVGDVRVQGQNATGHGAVAIGTVNVTAARSDGAGRVWFETLVEAGVHETASGYASTPSDRRLDRHLHQHHLVCLSGPVGSGRFTSATLAVARRHGFNRVCVLGVERLSDLLGAGVSLPAGHGYVVELSEVVLRAVDGFTLVALAARAATSGTTVVLVGDFSQRKHDFVSHVVDHRPAPATEVFRAQLRHQLRGRCVGWCTDTCDGRCLERYVDLDCVGHPLLSAYLAGEPRPSEVLKVVAALSPTAPKAGALAVRLEQFLPLQLRERAVEILDVRRRGEETDGFTDEEVRAFRLSCAVLAGQPVAEIHEAAQRLARQGFPEMTPIGAPLRGSAIDMLLGQALGQAVTRVPDGRVPGGCRIDFPAGSESIRSALLDVAWTDWWSPGQLLDWLADLIRADLPPVRQAAAGAIGWSATRDVRAALHTVGELARDRRAGVRQAAAIVLVAMAMQPMLRLRVRAELDQWAAGPAAHLQDTVARAYSLGLARLWPDVALAQLRQVARARMQRRNNSVVRGLVEVYENGHAASVVPALVDWAASADPEVQLHAARTLRVLADRWAEPPREHWPQLLHLVDQKVIRLADLAGLWAVALSLPRTAYRTWRTLGFWLDRADRQPAVAGHCLDLVRHLIAGEPALRHRLDHQLHHVWRPVLPQNDLLDDVQRLIDEETR
ncbi:HEAT repeat domain-containing protein [Micromonospora sp. NPDC048935]|uniref:HEAT repeat domain-containing protein n=1 Tax=Micromonospora sp. NPDC048935 TaxID=3364262 RepID=UPI003715779E